MYRLHAFLSKFLYKKASKIDGLEYFKTFRMKISWAYSFFTCSYRLLFFQNLLISILVMTILSTAGTIHCLQYYLFVYQVLRTFYMLTKSKISEARFQVRRTCNHVEHRRCDTFVFPNFEEICKHVEHRRCDTYLF